MGDTSVPFDSIDPYDQGSQGGGAAAAAQSKPGSTAYPIHAQALQIIGGLLKGMSAVQSGNYNAQIAEQNAHLSEIAASDAVLRGQIAASSALMRGGALEGKQKVAIAAAGVDVRSGSALDVLGDTSLMSKIDADVITNNAALDAWGYRTKASQFRQQAAIDRSEGVNAAGTSILGSAIGAASYGVPHIEFAT